MSKTMTRPDYSALANAVNPAAPGSPGQPGGGTGGNPDLAPIISNNVDATIEWYFAPKALLSASLFEMDLTSYVGFGLKNTQLMTPAGNGVAAGMYPYILTVPVNISANVKGLELAYEQPIGKNFGVGANYTYVNASDANGDPVVGASKNTGNLTAYYEDDSFNARLGYNYRSSYFDGLDRSTAFYQAATATLSATLGYKLNDHIGFTLDAMNLNNPVLKYYGVGEYQPLRFYQNGRQFYLNAHFKY